MTRNEVREKLTTILRDKLLSDIEADKDVPESLANYFLKNNGWSLPNSIDDHDDDLSEFIESLKKWIEESYLLINPCEKIFEVDYDLSKSYESFNLAESNYCKVTSDLVHILEEGITEKEKYSECVKNECTNQSETMETLAVKVKVLELQSLLKLYGERNALIGHINLKLKLKKELDEVNKIHKQVVESNEEYDKIKSDSSFCKLFKEYKELLRIKEMTDIIKDL